MVTNDASTAARERDRGLARIGGLTRLAALAGAGASVVVAFGLAVGHHGTAAGPTSSGSSSAARQHQQSPIVAPAQAPTPASGSGQVTSGGS